MTAKPHRRQKFSYPILSDLLNYTLNLKFVNIAFSLRATIFSKREMSPRIVDNFGLIRVAACIKPMSGQSVRTLNDDLLLPNLSDKSYSLELYFAGTRQLFLGNRLEIHALASSLCHTVYRYLRPRLLNPRTGQASNSRPGLF
jgi:hypothetical protein